MPSPLPHDVDVKPLIRISTLANILFACNQATAGAVTDALAERIGTQAV
jgi:methylglyoxal synthase